ncbi:hypothetical protein [Actinokineospora alba]|nr:hypothetical protein [Actinokineospora alba]
MTGGWDQELQPGQGFRFAVGTQSGVKSTVYRIWTARNRSDVYIAKLPTSSMTKVSLHESGNWQYSFLSNVAMKVGSKNSERHIERWKKPEPFAEGWIRAFFITIPRTELRLVNVEAADVRWIEDPGAGYWVSIEIVLVDPGVLTTLSFDGVLVGKLRLRNDGMAAVLATRHKPTKEEGLRIAGFRESFYTGPIPFQAESFTTPTVELFGSSNDGARCFTQISLTVPPAEVRTICTGDLPTSLPLIPKDNWKLLDLDSKD